jgi:tetratricopeptide (TPR) repeat protein
MMNDSDIRALFIRAGKNLPAIDQVAAQLLRNRYPLEHALRAYKDFLSYQPGNANAAFNYAYYLSRDGQFDAAVEMYERALARGIDAPEEVHLNIANIYMEHLKNGEMARQHLRRSLAIKPEYASAWYNLGNLSEQDGDRAEAMRCFENCLQYAPANESALARLADAHRFEAMDDPLLSRLAETARQSTNSDVHFAVGRAYEQLQQFDLAWQHFARANRLDEPGLPPYRQAVTEQVFNQIISQCDAQWLNRFKGASAESVFICGMFRTGSTLLEQVFAAHPAFTAGGESQFFPRLVAKALRNFPRGLSNIKPAAVRRWREQHKAYMHRLFDGPIRVTDKRPDNFLHIGLIKAVLPSAKFIVTEREWKDIATSVYSTRLGPGQNYATNLNNIRHYIGLQKQLVDHWQSLLGDDLMRVTYEDLVSQPRATVGGLLENLGEVWDERCLSFNQLKNTVQTASVWQVREPLHTRSVGRWSNYRRYFEEAFGTDLDA